MDRETRNAIERATQNARRLLQEDFVSQLEGTYDVLRSGVVAPKGGTHLSPRQQLLREKIVAAVEHKRAAGAKPGEAVTAYVRDAAFTTLNRFVALKMLEARELVQECITKGELSGGYREFCGLAPGVALLPDGGGYRLYIESLFDELSTEVRVLFDRRDPAAALWPKRQTFEDLLGALNVPELAGVWGEDETIGWVYQFFNSGEERRAMRESQAPGNSRELAVRNQFFTPRYVVRFLAENTLARMWVEMMGGATRIADECDFLVRGADSRGPRSKKDPRDIRLLDSACGSGHFLLYAFDLFLTIYEEAWNDPDAVPLAASGRTLRQDYPDLGSLYRAVPSLVLGCSLHGVDIDPRCAQIAALALWLRAQRAYRDLGIARTERPRITRTHIVVAEPMPGDESLVEAFAADLQPPLLHDLFKKIVAEMRLAGELGSLIRVDKGIGDELHHACEEWIRQREPGDYLPGLSSYRVQSLLDLSQIDDQQFFDEAEVILLAALRRFAESATGGSGVRRKLFADDAEQGIALIDLLRTKFDVVLMNPPFGDATGASQPFIARDYPEGTNDVYAAFVLRGREMLAHGGLLGAITSRSFLVGRDLRRFREALLTSERPHLTLLADLGGGVLDGAMVETAAFVVGIAGDDLLIRNIRKSTRKETELRAAASDPHAIKRISFEQLKGVPDTPILYELNAEESAILGDGAHLEPDVGRVTKGLSTGADERFVRLRWELPAGATDGWSLFSKGGEYAWFTGDVHLLVNRRDAGAEMAALAERGDGNTARTRQSSTYYMRPAVTWSRRSQKGFSARRLRAGVVFSDKSPVVIPEREQDAWIATLLGLMASDEYLKFVYAQSKFGSFETGAIRLLPAPREPIRPVAQAVFDLCDCLDRLDQLDERSQLFSSPSHVALATERASSVSPALDALGTALAQCGYRLSDEARRGVVDGVSERLQVLSHEHWPLSHAVGEAFGRWRENATPVKPGFVDAVERLAPLEGAESGQRGAGYFEDDPASASDLAHAIAKEFPALGEDEVRRRIRTEFFRDHLNFYSKSARAAPLYWQLAIPSTRYSVWLYAHALTKDTFFHLQNEIVAPKLGHEERRHASLVQEAGPNPTASQRKALAAQESFIDELRAFRDEVARIAPLWNPDLNDGILITAAPLWRLFPHHRAWQRELKTAWESLSAGEYDWAHLSIHLWPERVVPRCATDRSLAIAHGLEEEFWAEGPSGKWQPRAKPLRSVSELVGQRSSTAVKAALDRAGEAPADRVAAARRGRRRETS